MKKWFVWDHFGIKLRIQDKTYKENWIMIKDFFVEASLLF